MKKVLISSDSSLPRWDGIARFLSEIIPDLKKDFAITVIAPHFPGKFKGEPGVKYHRFPLINVQFADIYFAGFNYRKIRKLVKQHDIVFNQTIGPLGISAINAAKKEKKPCVQYIHSIDWELASKGVKRFHGFVRSVVKWLSRRYQNKCSLLLLPSRATEDKIVQNKVKTARMILPLGIKTNWFSPPRSKKKSKEKIGLDHNSFIVGFVGRIGREKDLPTLFKAFGKLRKEKRNCKLVIVGSGLESEIPKDPDVILVGDQTNVRKFLRAFDVFVLPSLTETSSLATMEAMSCGLPVVVTPVGNIPEYVQDLHNGLIFPREDDTALSEKLSLLYDDKALREKLGKKARKMIVSKYSWGKTVKKLKKILNEIAL